MIDVSALLISDLLLVAMLYTGKLVVEFIDKISEDL